MSAHLGVHPLVRALPLLALLLVTFLTPSAHAGTPLDMLPIVEGAPGTSDAQAFLHELEQTLNGFAWVEGELETVEREVVSRVDFMKRDVLRYVTCVRFHGPIECMFTP